MPIQEQLRNAVCTNPFAHLGAFWQAGKRRVVINAWLVGAEGVEVYRLVDEQHMGSLHRQGQTHYYSASFNADSVFLYRFKVSTSNGEYWVTDPYQFREQAYHAVHYIDHQPQNLYRQAGAQLTTVHSDGQDIAGCSFAVYAPNACAVSVIGDFNYFNGSCHPMQKTDMGYWVLFVPGIEAGCRYKYQLKDQQGQDLPHKADPLGFYAEQYPSHASIVYDHQQYQWQDAQWLASRSANYEKPMSIYEVHLGSWKRPDDAQQRYLSYIELADALIPYVTQMGYTHIELLPVSEHPFDGSWGYQPVGMFAPTSRFGNPDAFKYFVDQCHQQGIGVILDWVPAHFPEDGHGLARFDGGHVYEYADPRKGWHQDWNSCIYDFGKDAVRQFLVASALYWLDKFHIDGLRVDAVASMLYLDYSRNEGEWIPNVDGGNQNYEAISLLQWMNREVYAQFPTAMTIAEESTSFPKVSGPVHQGGLGFGYKWNMGWMHDSLHYISKDPSYRQYHHNEMTFSMAYAFDENFVLPLSHDEVVHGKGALLRKMPGDEWQQAANQRCYAAFMYAHPGKKLNFMGNELGQTEEWNHDGSVAWHLLAYAKHSGIQRLYKTLNRLYTHVPALHQQDHQPQGFQWLEHHNAEQSLLAFVRYDKQGNACYILCNFTPVPRDAFRLGVAQGGDYQLLLNTDDNDFWGSGYRQTDHFTAESVPSHQLPYSICVDLPPLACLYIGKPS